MIIQLKLLLSNFKLILKFPFIQTRELEWAHIFHDSIRGRDWLEKLPLNIGRWAGNYSLFYILTRILIDYKPKNIIEFGLGESTKLISTFIKNELFASNHVILEQSSEWIEKFQSIFSIIENSKIIHLPVIECKVNKYLTFSYKDVEKTINEKFDLYIVDGPTGSDRFSRNDICKLADKLTINDEFIILIDDYDRKGEKDTAKELIDILNKKGIPLNIRKYIGNKEQLIIATEKYKFSVSF